MIDSIDEWAFRDFMTKRGSNVIREWTFTLPIAAQAKFDWFLLMLRVQKVWPPHYVSSLRGYGGIYELRVGCSGVQYRPLGCYGPGIREFTILHGAVEKGGKLPRGTCESAVEQELSS